MELHSETANRKIGDDDDDLAEYMRQAGAGASVVDMAQMICDEDRIVLLDGDALRASLENASQNGEGRDVQYFSIRRIEPNEDAAKSASGQQPGLIVMMRKKKLTWTIPSLLVRPRRSWGRHNRSDVAEF